MSYIHAAASTRSLPSSTSSDESLVSQPHSQKDDASVPNPAATEQPEAAAELLLDAAKDVRQIVRLVQCQLCWKILQNPITLPCGHSICKSCFPQTRARANISWPATANRLQGFDCPFRACGKEHAAADCAIDVTLNKVLDIIKMAVTLDRATADHPDIATHVTVHDRRAVAGLSQPGEREVESSVVKGGRILATYTLAESGKLQFNSEVSYSSIGGNEDEVTELDSAAFERLKESVRSEMDCQVCYALFLDPMTTTCGHTYCRACLHGILNRSNLCPICRRTVSLQSHVDPRSSPSNGRLVSMINGFWADLIALRAQAYRLEQQANYGGFDIPIFVCTLAYPSMPLFLHVFEARYRLMIQRAMEGDRTFGMVVDRTNPLPGESHFMPFGTLMRIVNIEFFPDGRSLLETVGVSRFRVTQHGWLDGYVVANIEKVDDISIAEEEAIEASEFTRGQTLLAQGSLAQSTTNGTMSESTSPIRETPVPAAVNDLNSMSTQQLVDFGVDFVRRMQAQSVTWLATRMIAIYGDCPIDPAVFPWWFASVLPVSDAEKYRLLGTSSVRQRLKIACEWAVEWEASRAPYGLRSVITHNHHLHSTDKPTAKSTKPTDS
ncbi:ATP-dependent protease La domain-containing protein [Xylariaceae sp. FL1272]|nr:ATP-dependent protease La domain-containing protein [Xylariaceae sp. FL1272]